VFFSKIWFFLVAVGAAASLTIALTLPRPAERATAVSETVRLKRACGVTNILLTQNARDRVDLASAFARADAPPGRPRLKVDSILYNASKADKISKDMHLTAKSAIAELVDNVKGNKPDFVIAIDHLGRVVARNGVDEDKWGDSVKGYFAVDDALDGYLRDDIWRYNNSLYRIAASPVIERRAGAYAGVIVLGHEFNNALAEKLTDSSGAFVAFYAAGGATASSNSATIHKDVVAGYEKVIKTIGGDGSAQEDCANGEPFVVGTDTESFNVMIARLPGEGRQADAFFAVYAERPKGVGFMGTLNQVTSNDLKFGNFPWIPVALAFLAAFGIGIALMVYETDRPTRRLVKDAVALAKGEVPRLEELKHKGKYGSIARSVNIVLDKLERETKAAKRDLDNILGPAPDSPVKKAVPSAGPAGVSAAPFAPPPPSEFKFNDGGGRIDSVRPPTEDQSGPVAAPFDLDLPPPPPALAQTPPPRPSVSAPPPQPPRKLATPIPPAPISLPPDEPPRRPMTPPPLPPSEATPPPALMPQAPEHIDEDILADDSGPSPAVPAGRTRSDFDDPTVVADPSHSLLEQSAQPDGSGLSEGEFRKVFDEFTALKKQCGESVASLTFEKFSNKLRKNRDALIAKHGCRSVKFQVYIKDGKAALKATPVKS